MTSYILKFDANPLPEGKDRIDLKGHSVESNHLLFVFAQVPFLPSINLKNQIKGKIIQAKPPPMDAKIEEVQLIAPIRVILPLDYILLLENKGLFCVGKFKEAYSKEQREPLEVKIYPCLGVLEISPQEIEKIPPNLEDKLKDGSFGGIIITSSIMNEKISFVQTNYGFFGCAKE